MRRPPSPRSAARRFGAVVALALLGTGSLVWPQDLVLCTTAWGHHAVEHVLLACGASRLAHPVEAEPLRALSTVDGEHSECATDEACTDVRLDGVGDAIPELGASLSPPSALIATLDRHDAGRPAIGADAPPDATSAQVRSLVRATVLTI